MIKYVVFLMLVSLCFLELGTKKPYCIVKGEISSTSDKPDSIYLITLCIDSFNKSVTPIKRQLLTSRKNFEVRYNREPYQNYLWLLTDEINAKSQLRELIRLPSFRSEVPINENFSIIINEVHLMSNKEYRKYTLKFPYMTARTSMILNPELVNVDWEYVTSHE